MTLAPCGPEDGDPLASVSRLPPFGAPLGQHHNLSTRFVLFHAAMRLNDFVKVKDFADLDVQCARCDLLDQFIERRAREIFRFAGIGGQADCSRDCLHRGEIVERPFVADHTRHANDPALFGTTQRILQRRRAYQFEHFVDTPGTDLSDLFGDRAGIDEHLINTARQQQVVSVGVASRSRDEGAVVHGDRCGRQPG